MIISQSELGDFLRCRRRWWLRYVRGLAPRRVEVAGTPLALGSRVHGALQALYEHHEDPLEYLRASVALDLEAFPEQSDELQADADLADAMLSGYLEWVVDEGFDEGTEILGAERVVRAPMRVGDQEVTLVGKLDLKVRREFDGAILFRDFKTVGSFADIERVAHLSSQFLMYDLLQTLEARASGGPELVRTDGGVYVMLRKVKRTPRATPPFYKPWEVRHNLDELRSYWLKVHGIIEEMLRCRERLEAGEDPRVVVFPTPEKSCSWQCQFFSVCHMLDDGSDSEFVLQDAYEPRDPYERYASGQNDPRELGLSS